MSVRRHKHDGVALDDGRVFIAGGADERDNEGVYSSAELFDPSKARFQAMPDMRLGRYKHRGTVFVLSSRRLLLGCNTGGGVTILYLARARWLAEGLEWRASFQPRHGCLVSASCSVPA